MAEDDAQLQVWDQTNLHLVPICSRFYRLHLRHGQSKNIPLSLKLGGAPNTSRQASFSFQHSFVLDV
jgi:hypothetical protein